MLLKKENKEQYNLIKNIDVLETYLVKRAIFRFWIQFNTITYKTSKAYTNTEKGECVHDSVQQVTVACSVKSTNREWYKQVTVYVQESFWYRLIAHDEEKRGDIVHSQWQIESNLGNRCKCLV